MLPRIKSIIIYLIFSGVVDPSFLYYKSKNVPKLYRNFGIIKDKFLGLESLTENQCNEKTYTRKVVRFHFLLGVKNRGESEFHLYNLIDLD